MTGRTPGLSVFVGLVLVTVVALQGPRESASAEGERANAAGIVTRDGSTAAANCPPGGTGSSPGGTFEIVGTGALTTSCTDAMATASAASVTLVGLRIGVAQSQCTAAGPASSSVLVVSGGGPTSGLVTGPVTIGVGVTTVKLNELTTTDGFVTVNALHINMPGGADIVVSQSRCMATTAHPHPTTSGSPGWLLVVAVLTGIISAGVVVGDVLRRRHSAVRGHSRSPATELASNAAQRARTRPEDHAAHSRHLDPRKAATPSRSPSPSGWSATPARRS